jgi:nucleoside-diphosphate-sugar epimerase
MAARPILITGASGQLGHALAERTVPAIRAQDETT